MQEFLKRNFKGDLIIWIVFLSLILISALEMYSASSTLAFKQADYTLPVWRHVMFLTFGFILAFVVHLFHYKYFSMIGVALYPISIIFLLLTLFRGVSLNEASRWFEIGGIQFQPSEMAKLATIVTLAYVLSRYQKEGESSDEGFKYYVLVLLIPAGLILLENFSTFALLLLVGFTMIFIGRISWKLFFKIVGVVFAVVALLLSLILLSPDEEKNNKASQESATELIDREKHEESSFEKALHRASVWKRRVLNFFDEEVLDETYVIDGDNYQESHAKMAIANSKGIGLWPGNSIERDFLPQAFSDFIFAIIVEEMGFIGFLLVIMLYLILLFRVGVLLTKCSSAFSAFLILGLACMIVYQAFVNISVAVNLIPVTGQPLPMISRGGTSILITSIYFGMILSVSRYVNMEQEEKSSSKSEKPDVGTEPEKQPVGEA